MTENYQLPCGCYMKVVANTFGKIIDEMRCAYHASKEYENILKALNGGPQE